MSNGQAKLYQDLPEKRIVRQRFFSDIAAVMKELNPVADQLQIALINVRCRSRYFPTGLLSLSSRREGLLVGIK
jgi:hypothetical protein